MSGLISTATGYQLVVGMNNSYNDDILQPVTYRMSLPLTRQGRDRDAGVLWSRSSMVGIDVAVRGTKQQQWDYPFAYSSGRSGARLISGVAYGATGSPIPGATVRLFNTATGLLVCTATADSAGNYVVTEPNNVASFVVAYLPGSPDVAGTTVNTL